MSSQRKWGNLSVPDLLTWYPFGSWGGREPVLWCRCLFDIAMFFGEKCRSFARCSRRNSIKVQPYGCLMRWQWKRSAAWNNHFDIRMQSPRVLVNTFCKFTITCQFYLSKKIKQFILTFRHWRENKNMKWVMLKKDKKKSTLQPAFTLATSTVDIIGLNFAVPR